jgi:hypothetical protein
MKLRFTIRDLLWLIAIVGMVTLIGGQIEHFNAALRKGPVPDTVSTRTHLQTVGGISAVIFSLVVGWFRRPGPQS